MYMHYNHFHWVTAHLQLYIIIIIIIIIKCDNFDLPRCLAYTCSNFLSVNIYKRHSEI